MTAGQGLILRRASRPGSETAAWFSQEPQKLREAHEDEADPRSRWKSIHWSASGLITAARDKHSSVSTRQVHRDRTFPQPNREVHLQVWVQINRDHGQAKTAELQTRIPPAQLWEKQETRLRLNGSHELMGREGGEAPPEVTQDH